MEDALDFVNKMDSNYTVDLKNLFFIGGSHSGFIGAHMIDNKKNPRKFNACILRKVKCIAHNIIISS
jgi:hypothetical protein